MFLVGSVQVKGKWFPCRIKKDRDRLYCTILETPASVSMGLNDLELEFPRGDQRVRYNPKWAKNAMADDNASVGDTDSNADKFELESIHDDNVSLASAAEYSINTEDESTEIIFPPDWQLASYKEEEEDVDSGAERNAESKSNANGGGEDEFRAFDYRKIKVYDHHRKELRRQKREAKKRERKERSDGEMLNILKKYEITKNYMGKKVKNGGEETRKQVMVKKKGYTQYPNYVEFGCSQKKKEEIKKLIADGVDERARNDSDEESESSDSRAGAWVRAFGCFKPSRQNVENGPHERL